MNGPLGLHQDTWWTSA